MRRQDGLIRGAAMIVAIASVANRLFLAAVAVGLVATWLFPGFFAGVLIEADAAVDVPLAIIGIRLLMAIGIVMAVATDRLLVSLRAIVGSATAGDPFVPANAGRLRTIGWALLALQLLDLAGAMLARFWPSLGTAAPSGDISVGGWVATLMVFVLARVFAAGSEMRDELEGTV
jgi:hypothetical protein